MVGTARRSVTAFASPRLLSPRGKGPVEPTAIGLRTPGHDVHDRLGGGLVDFRMTLVYTSRVKLDLL